MHLPLFCAKFVECVCGICLWTSLYDTLIIWNWITAESLIYLCICLFVTLIWFDCMELEVWFGEKGTQVGVTLLNMLLWRWLHSVMQFLLSWFCSVFLVLTSLSFKANISAIKLRPTNIEPIPLIAWLFSYCYDKILIHYNSIPHSSMP